MQTTLTPPSAPKTQKPHSEVFGKSGIKAISVRDFPDDKIIREATLDALAAGYTAAQKAVVVGHYLLAKKADLEHGQFEAWRAKTIPELPESTAQRWQTAAMRSAKAALTGYAPAQIENGVIEVDGEVISISQVLTTPEQELSKSAREAKQLLLDFCADKTIKDCLSAVVNDGDADSRITRAANGKSKGGSNGEDRKDWPAYIGRHTSDITFLIGGKEKNKETRWKGMTAGQREKIQDAFTTALGNWPTGLLEHIANAAKEELKKR